MSHVAVVTGANKGIGFATVEGLANQFNGIIYLTARNEERGMKAVKTLENKLELGAADKIRFHQLDVTDMESVFRFRDHVKSEYGGIDILINNAAVAISEEMNFEKKNEITMRVNYYGLRSVCEAFFPLLRPHSRVVNVTSRAGALRAIESEEMQRKLISPDLKEAEIDEIINIYIQLCKEGKHLENGFPQPYPMSKICVTALSRIQSHCFQQKSAQDDIIVNSCCPGLVATDMSAPLRKSHGILKPGDMFLGMYPVKTVDEGADTLIYLALLPHNVNGPKGELVAERKIVDWMKVPTEKELVNLAATQGLGH